MLGFFLRHTYPLKRDFDLLSDMVYWPMVDTLLWGVTSQWLVESSGVTNLIVSILLALILWNVIWRSQAEVSRNLMDEIWNNNLVNLFSTPFTIGEWISGVLGLSVLKTALTLTILVPAILLLYSVNVFVLGWWLPVFFLAMAMTGWWLGFLSAGIVLRYGPRVQTVIWTLPGALLPFSAIYFPQSQLPAWAIPISSVLPTTYMFEAMRALLNGTAVNMVGVGIGFGLNVVYLTVMMWFFRKSFEKSLELGLGRFN